VKEQMRWVRGMYEQCPIAAKNAFDYNLSERKAIDVLLSVLSQRGCD